MGRDPQATFCVRVREGHTRRTQRAAGAGDAGWVGGGPPPPLLPSAPPPPFPWRARSAARSMALATGGLLLLLGGLLVRGGAGAEPCRAPGQWEGRSVRYDHGTGRNTRAAVSYDGLNQRLRILEERKALIPCKKFFEYILLYKDAVMFQIEQVTKLCSKIALTEPWDPYDIPTNSTFEDQYYIGGPGDQIMVQEWSDRKPARKLESWVGVYTVKDCYPVQETYTKNYSVTTSTRFFDLKLGIADPSVFTPPSTCQTAQPRKMKDEC
ncbi:mammalian ependymin-related protein 1 isoform X2 [Gallus gallus]|nr:mammalian ependymin-related protein 1 isoform X2 [Gallus gallus]